MIDSHLTILTCARQFALAQSSNPDELQDMIHRGTGLSQGSRPQAPAGGRPGMVRPLTWLTSPKSEIDNR